MFPPTLPKKPEDSKLSMSVNVLTVSVKVSVSGRLRVSVPRLSLENQLIMPSSGIDDEWIAYHLSKPHQFETERR